jgi:cytochrome c556
MPSTTLHSSRAATSAALLLAALSSGTVFGHEHAVGVTSERMEMMKGIASQMKTLGDMLEGRATYDPAGAQEKALALYQNCHAVATRFPDGPHDHHSRADPAIWERPDEFRKEMNNLQHAVGELVSATSSGPRDVVRLRFVDVGRACKSCHETFRLPEN